MGYVILCVFIPHRRVNRKIVILYSILWERIEFGAFDKRGGKGLFIGEKKWVCFSEEISFLA